MTDTSLFHAISERVFDVLPLRNDVPIALHFHSLFAAAVYVLFIGRAPSRLRDEQAEFRKRYMECRAKHPTLCEAARERDAYEKIVKHARSINEDINRLIGATDDEVFEDYLQLVFMASQTLDIDHEVRGKVNALLDTFEAIRSSLPMDHDDDTYAGAPLFVRNLLADHALSCRHEIDMFIEFFRAADSYFDAVRSFQNYICASTRDMSAADAGEASSEAFAHFGVAAQIYAFFEGAEYALQQNGNEEAAVAAPPVRLHGAPERSN